MNVLDTLADVAGELTAAGLGFAVVGGFAVAVRAEPRFTRDADLAVAVHDDAEAEAIVRRLIAAGFSVLATVEQEATGRLATVRLVREGGDAEGFVVDLLFASSAIETEIVAAATEAELAPGISLPVATTAHLIAMKTLSEDDSRFQDSADLITLLTGASAEEIADARGALRLIARRGASRGKDLQAVLDRYIALAAKR